jgi:beta-1,4-mannosyl-glycoprotein beta-1,4-N-acetylglucosaminyltransferase
MSAPRIFDCFTFFNELDLLEIRLRELRDVVDYFVICEAAQTFTGSDKPLYFAENKSRFAEFLPQIIHVVVEDFPDCKSSWDREAHQREQMRRGLAATRAGDLVMLSDVDEIPRPEVIERIKTRGVALPDVWCLELDWHVFYLDVRLKQKWGRIGPRIIRAESLKTFSGLRCVYAPTEKKMRDLVRWIKACRRMRGLVRRHVAKDAGWHFTWLGGPKAVAEKGGSICEHSNLPVGKKDVSWAKQRMDAVLGEKNAYDVVQIDESFPRLLRERRDIFDKYSIRSNLQ